MFNLFELKFTHICNFPGCSNHSIYHSFQTSDYFSESNEHILHQKICLIKWVLFLCRTYYISFIKLKFLVQSIFIWLEKIEIFATMIYINLIFMVIINHKLMCLLLHLKSYCFYICLCELFQTIYDYLCIYFFMYLIYSS